jgi:thiamine-phosphate diphosphorylase
LLETRPAGPWLVVNDHLEAARPFAGQARLGLHLGQDDTSALTARHQLGESALIGLSTHNLVQVESALALPVDYLGFGPVRATTGKARPGATTGFEALARAVAAAEPRPVVAIGGLEAADVAAVRAAGATAMAVIGAWLGPSDAPREPEAAGQALARLVAAWGAKP